MTLSDVCLSDVCRVHPVSGLRVWPAIWMARIGWSGPARPPLCASVAGLGGGIPWQPPAYSLFLVCFCLLEKVSKCYIQYTHRQAHIILMATLKVNLGYLVAPWTNGFCCHVSWARCPSWSQPVGMYTSHSTHLFCIHHGSWRERASLLFVLSSLIHVPQYTNAIKTVLFISCSSMFHNSFPYSLMPKSSAVH